VKITLTNSHDLSMINSTLFGDLIVPADLNLEIKKGEFCLAQIDIFELPEKTFNVKSGFIYFIVDNDGYHGRVVYLEESSELLRVKQKIPFQQFKMRFLQEPNCDGIKLLGKPSSLNRDLLKNEVLLFQYDPLDNDNLEFLEYMDGVVYFAIKEKDLKKALFHKAYFVRDNT